MYSETQMASTKESDDMGYATDFLKEELEGIGHYKEAVMLCHDPDLKKILADVLEQEKRHAHALLSWLTSHAANILK